MGKSRLALLILISLLLFSCATKPKHEIKIPKKEIEREKVQETARPQLKTPDFRIENEPLDPLSLKRVSVNVRAAPLRDILFVICKDAGLNLVIEKDVDPNLPTTVILQNVTLKDALDGVLSSTDYFYTIERNILTVKTRATKIFHLNVTPVIQQYGVDVGGDILGGVTGQLVAGAQATGTTQLKGSVTKSEKGDDTAYKFWDALEKTISNIIGQDGVFHVNRLTGTIMVSATKRALKLVEDYIESVKKVLSRQVTIEAKVIEVALTSGLKYGIDWSFLREWTHGSRRFTLGGGTTDFTSVVPGSSPSSGITFSFTSTTIRNFDLIIKALSEFGDIRTLSNPRISVVNGQPSLLTVGRNFTFISKAESSISTAVGGTPIITYTVETSNLLSGLMIGIVPYVNEEGEITLTITPIVSNLLGIETRTFGTTGSQTLIQLPTVDLRELSTIVRVKNEEIVVIGGLIKKEEKFVEHKTPVIGDLPLIGGLFKGKDKEEISTELVILLQPRIIR
ncbi:MAG: hypothetical protein N2513_06800 [Deltaproteobacteria bacterium]|nr:hypothetical protein [Deltaproteobacteria bacterium]